MVDTGAAQLLAKVPLPFQRHGQVDSALSPDGRRLYLTVASAGKVQVTDLTGSAAPVAIPVGDRPGPVRVSPDGKWLYVANTASNTVSVIDTAMEQVAATVPVGASPAGLALSPDGRWLAVTNEDDGTVSLVDTASGQVGTIRVGSQPGQVVFKP